MRIKNLPWLHAQDNIIQSMGGLLGRPVVLTEYVDGLPVAMTRLELRLQPKAAQVAAGPLPPDSITLLRAYYARCRNYIPLNKTVHAVWSFDRRAIYYPNLLSPLLVWGLYEPRWKLFADWKDTQSCAWNLGLPTVPELQRTKAVSEAALRALVLTHMNGRSHLGAPRPLGVVVRTMTPFSRANAVIGKVIVPYTTAGEAERNPNYWWGSGSDGDGAEAASMSEAK